MIRVLLWSAMTTVLILGCYIFTGGRLAVLYQPAALCLIVFAMVGYSVAAGRLGVWGDIIRDLRAANSGAEGSRQGHQSGQILAAMRSMETTAQAAGAIAALFGLIRTMGSITEPPEVLGYLIGASLVPIVYGLLIAHGVIGPIAARLAAYYDRVAASAKPVS